MTDNSHRLTALFLAAALCILSAGCSLKTGPPAPLPRTGAALPPEGRTASPPPGSSASPADRPNPRMLAAANLVEQGRQLLENGRPDQALALLERALSLHPGNGRTYFYMAEAWLMKNNKRQALEFNRLAGMYLRGDKEWLQRVNGQHARIKALL